VPGGGGGPATANRGPEPDFVRERSRYVSGRVRLGVCSMRAAVRVCAIARACSMRAALCVCACACVRGLT
jgi:hypothetical protein